MTKLMLLGNLSVGWALFGLIWTIQLVHYPAFRYVPDFSEFHGHHTSSITMIVGPLMLAELGLAVLMAYQSNWNWMWIVPLVLVVLIWLNTFFQAIPLHEQLAVTRDDEVIERLISVNWPRTLLWTVKAGWVSWLVYKSFGK